jgi:hypothetical protein
MIESPKSHYAKSSSTAPALRIGLLLDSQRTVPAYVAKIISDLRASNFVELLVAVAQKNAIAGERTKKGRVLYNRYLRLDARMKPKKDPLSRVDCSDLLSSIDALELDWRKEEEQFPAEAIEMIRSKRLDVLIRFGFDSLGGEIAKTAKFGIWSFQHSDTEFYRGGPTQFWEMRERNPFSGVVLQAVTQEQSEPVVLAKSLFATEQTISVSRNRYIPYWGSADLLVQKLHELHEFGWDYVVERALPNASYKGKRDRYEYPGNGEMVAWLAPILLKKAAAYPFRSPQVQHWRVATRRGSVPLFDAHGDCSGFRWIEPPRGHAWADPFLFQHEGKYWGFFEDYSYASMRGSIACAEISQNGDWGPPIVCLENASCHYSYPHVFRDGSEIFMIPESYDSNFVELYRCRQFPNHWVREAVLLEGRFIDSTVWQHEELWWFATTSADPVPGGNSLWLYYSQSLTGEWKFHPRNPISRDIRYSRAAGRVFRHQDRLIRTSQSGAPTYGYSINFHEITNLSVQCYAERVIKTVTPEHWKGMAGVHTYNCAGDLEVIDGRSARPLKAVR